MAVHLTRIPGVNLRPTRDEDRDFLLEVFAETREEELAAVPWSETERAMFLRFQFAAQDASYRQAYPDALFLVVESEAIPIGRLSLAQLPDEIRVIDLALLSGHRGRGIGTRILTALLAEASELGLPVRLHVMQSNRARRLYERLGFRVVEEGDVRVLMEHPVEVGATN